MKNRSLVVLLLTLAACPDGEEKPSLADAPAALAAAYCEAAPRCALDFHATFDGSDCVPTVENILANRLLPGWQDGVAGGSITFDAEAMNACLDSLADSCAPFQVEDGFPCLEAAFVGTVAAGGACSIDEQCAGDAHCELLETCPGTCVSNGVEGATCAGGETCAAGLVCARADDRCHVPPSAGGACDPADGEDACAAGSICLDDGTPICETIASLLVGESGEACGLGPHQLCQPGLVCIFSPDPENGLCRAPLAAGAACNPFGFPDPCGADHYCKIDENSGTGECAAMPRDGERCRDRDRYDLPCATGYVCGGPESTCVPGAQIGETCNDGGDCWSRVCIDGTCAAETCE